MVFDAIVVIDFKPPPTMIKNLARGLKQHGHLLIESYLMEAAKEQKEIEAFECYKKNELLTLLAPATNPNLQTLYYSELGEKWGHKACFIAKKTQLL